MQHLHIELRVPQRTERQNSLCLGVSIPMRAELIATGKIPTLEGRRSLYRRVDLDQWLAD